MEYGQSNCVHSGQCRIQRLVQRALSSSCGTGRLLPHTPSSGLLYTFASPPRVCAVRGNPAHDPTSAGRTGLQLSAPRDRLAFCSSQALRRVTQSLPQSPGGHRLGLSGSTPFSNTPQSPSLPQPQAGCGRCTVACDLERLRTQQGTGETAGPCGPPGLSPGSTVTTGPPRVTTTQSLCT